MTTAIERKARRRPNPEPLSGSKAKHLALLLFRIAAFVALPLALLGACARAPDGVEPRASVSNPPAARAIREPRPRFLRIAPLTIMQHEMQAPEGSCCARCDPAGQPWLVVYANGLLAVRGNPLGHLRSDGRFVDLDGVDRILMNPEGHVTMAPGTKNPIAGLEVVVAEDGKTSVRVPGLPDEPASVTALAERADCQVVSRAPSVNGREMLDQCRCTQVDKAQGDLKRTIAFAQVVSDVIRDLSLTACYYGSTGVCFDYPGEAPTSAGYNDP